MLHNRGESLKKTSHTVFLGAKFPEQKNLLPQHSLVDNHHKGCTLRQNRWIDNRAVLKKSRAENLRAEHSDHNARAPPYATPTTSTTTSFHGQRSLFRLGHGGKQCEQLNKRGARKHLRRTALSRTAKAPYHLICRFVFFR
jgi:hypothetical protein